MLRREACDVALGDGPAQHPLSGLIAIGLEQGVSTVEVQDLHPGSSRSQPASLAEMSS